MLISELATKTGANRHKIRYYEKLNLIQSSGRRENNYREYDEDAVYLLQFIHQLKALGFTLQQIKSIIDVFDTDPQGALGTAHEMLVAKREELDTRIRKDQGTLAEVDNLLDQCGSQGHQVSIPDLVRSLREDSIGKCQVS